MILVNLHQQPADPWYDAHLTLTHPHHYALPANMALDLAVKHGELAPVQIRLQCAAFDCCCRVWVHLQPQMMHTAPMSFAPTCRRSSSRLGLCSSFLAYACHSTFSGLYSSYLQQ
jgi:hypothetical protein